MEHSGKGCGPDGWQQSVRAAIRDRVPPESRESATPRPSRNVLENGYRRPRTARPAARPWLFTRSAPILGLRVDLGLDSLAPTRRTAPLRLQLGITACGVAFAIASGRHTVPGAALPRARAGVRQPLTPADHLPHPHPQGISSPGCSSGIASARWSGRIARGHTLACAARLRHPYRRLNAGPAGRHGLVRVFSGWHAGRS